MLGTAPVLVKKLAWEGGAQLLADPFPMVVVDEASPAEVTLTCSEESTLDLAVLTLPYNETCEDNLGWGRKETNYCGRTPKMTGCGRARRAGSRSSSEPAPRSLS